MIGNMSSNPHKIEFIHVFNPHAGLSSPYQERTRSHAAREAHARVRRLRMAKYQARGRFNQKPIASTADEHGISEVISGQLQATVPHDTHELMPSPRDLVTSDCRDPFASSARILGRVEHFLLGHCTSHPPWVLHTFILSDSAD